MAVHEIESSAHFYDALTPREIEFLRFKAENYHLTRKEVADCLSLSENTVKWRIRQLNRKLDTENLGEAMSRAADLGLIAASYTRDIKLPGSLPTQTSRFIGREEEIGRLIPLLDASDTRLATIVGPGGIGKTRLALAVAELLVDHFADGVCFVSLAAVDAQHNIMAAIADQLTSPYLRGPRDPEQRLLDYLHDKQLLLVLDNYDHLIAGAAVVVALLEAAPGVKVLVTSRETLGVYGEKVFALRGMPLTASAEAPISDSVRLFVESARRVQPDFSFTNQNLPTIISICQIVEGMPLAIELAAAWARSLSVDDIAAELHQGLDILQRRRRSIRGVFEQSWRLLTDEQRNALMRLSVFRGGCTREAAEAVAGANWRLLAALVEKSLIAHDEHGRYRMHELLRQYAQEQLARSNQTDAYDAHCTYYAGYLAKKHRDLQSGLLVEVLKENDNLRAAWDHAVRHGRMADIRRFMWAWSWVFAIKGWHSEAAAVFGGALDRLGESGLDGERDIVYGTLLVFQGFHARCSGDIAHGSRRLREGLALLEKLGAQKELAWCSTLQWHQGYEHVPHMIEDYDQFKQTVHEGIAIFRHTNDEWSLTHSINTLGDVASEFGDYEAARAYHQEALRLNHKLKNYRGEAWAQVGLAIAAIGMGDYARAKRHLIQGINLSKVAGYTAKVGSRTMMLAWVEYHLGNFQEAYSQLRRALNVLQDAPDVDWVRLDAVTLYAHLLAQQADDAQAAELLAIVMQHAALSAKTGNRAADKLRLLLNGDAYDTQSAPEKRPDLDDLVNVLLDGSLALQFPEGESEALAKPLTKREREVLGHLAAGLANDEIAARLGVKTSTVKKHLNRLYHKLGVESRTQALLRAQDLNLV